MKDLSRKFLFLSLLVSFLFAGLLFLEEARFSRGSFDTVFFHIPEGDAILLKTPNGKFIAIDGGTDETFTRALSGLLPFFHREIEAMIITHPDLDHFLGAVSLIQKFPVRRVLVSGKNSGSPEFQELIMMIEREKIPLIFLNADTDFLIDGVSFDVLSPSRSLVGDGVLSSNDSSLVIMARYGETSVLFAGDLEFKGEALLLREPFPIRSNALKVSHHGSKGASSLLFLSAADPEFAIISAGEENRFGHPHAEALLRLQAEEASVLLTKETGDIHLSSDGKAFSFTDSGGSLLRSRENGFSRFLKKWFNECDRNLPP